MAKFSHSHIPIPILITITWRVAKRHRLDFCCQNSVNSFLQTRRSLAQLETSQNLPRHTSRTKDDLSQHMIICPTILRLAWPSYNNEAIFLFHATALVFFSSFPAWR
jgi:hypothetical protein